MTIAALIAAAAPFVLQSLRNVDLKSIGEATKTALKDDLPRAERKISAVYHYEGWNQADDKAGSVDLERQYQLPPQKNIMDVAFELQSYFKSIKSTDVAISSKLSPPYVEISCKTNSIVSEATGAGVNISLTLLQQSDTLHVHYVLFDKDLTALELMWETGNDVFLKSAPGGIWGLCKLYNRNVVKQIPYEIDQLITNCLYP